MRGELRTHAPEQAAWLAAGKLRVAGENPTVTSPKTTAACMWRCFSALLGRHLGRTAISGRSFTSTGENGGHLA
eukprot:scaffold26255_cov59-Phaeocystis_antarctica.AAC.2